jgi:type IV pilus assembly protein PilY1
MASGSPSRRDQLVNAMQDIINDPEFAGINAALLGYTTNTGNNGPLDLRALSGNFKLFEGNTGSFVTQVNTIRTRSYTPTVKAMEAAVNWFRRDIAFTDSYNRTMTSPIDGNAADNWCRPNHIVLLSDGAPNSNSPTSGQAYGLTSWMGTTCARDSTSRWTNGRCAREIATWAFNTDLETGAGWEETQNITTHAIGFDVTSTTSTFLQSLTGPFSGGGGYYPVASSAAGGLKEAFASILDDALENIPYTYTAPVIPFNPDNAAISGSRIYIPLFVPSATTFWKGNLKAYNIAVVDGDVVLRDAAGHSVVNAAYEFVSSQDLWASDVDGGEVLVGGAAELMGASGTRNLYTNIDAGLPLSDTVNQVGRTNTSITNAMMDVATDDERFALLDWITWDYTPVDADDEDHEGVMGAPFHSQPAVVNYSSGDVVYLPTSEGVLEAIDAESGTELWAFMPEDLLGNIAALKTNNDSTTPYYGIDGPLTAYETASGTKMLIFGMRRGGQKYYLLDVSDKFNPRLIREISDSDSNFSLLGQTWSKPLFVKMEIGSAEQEVLVFGGGYDEDQDDASSRVADDEGNVIYVVDATTGDRRLIISGSGGDITVPNMTNSIPSDIKTIDLDGDALVDRIYAADVAGRIIRVDLAAGRGGIVADINAGSSSYRKFFNAPQVGYYSKGGAQFLALLIGTGDRSDPLDSTVLDRFYMIKDQDLWFAPATYTTVTETDLENASSSAVDRSVVLDNASGGWYMNFSSSEKSFSQAVLYDYAIFFTTYSAVRAEDLGDCEARGATGTARLYGINMIDANAVIHWGGDSDAPLSASDRSDTLNMLGIPPSPTLVFPGEDNDGTQVIGRRVHLLVGMEKKTEWSDRFRPIYWEEVIHDN